MRRWLGQLIFWVREHLRVHWIFDSNSVYGVDARRIAATFTTAAFAGGIQAAISPDNISEAKRRGGRRTNQTAPSQGGRSSLVTGNRTADSDLRTRSPNAGFEWIQIPSGRVAGEGFRINRLVALILRTHYLRLATTAKVDALVSVSSVQFGTTQFSWIQHRSLRVWRQRD
jgi:hypothetical protein